MSSLLESEIFLINLQSDCFPGIHYSNSKCFFSTDLSGVQQIKANYEKVITDWEKVGKRKLQVDYQIVNMPYTLSENSTEFL